MNAKTTTMTALVAALLLVRIASAGVVYDSGSPQRPLQITGLNLANGTFTATFDYGVTFGTATIDQSAITGSSDADVQAALIAQLNTQGVQSAPTKAWLSVIDIAPSGDPAKFNGNAIVDSDGALDNWTFATLTFDDSNTSNSDIALITFSSSATSSVPEPGSFGLLAIGGIAAVARRRRSAKLDIASEGFSVFR